MSQFLSRFITFISKNIKFGVCNGLTVSFIFRKLANEVEEDDEEDNDEVPSLDQIFKVSLISLVIVRIRLLVLCGISSKILKEGKRVFVREKGYLS